MIVIEEKDLIKSLTVDSVDITVDNTLITVDATIIGTGETKSIRFIPRFFTPICRLILRNELTNTVLDLEKEMINDNGMAIILIDNDLGDEGSYQMTVFDLEDNLIFRGKAFSTNNEDIQNYSMNKRKGNKILI